MLFLISSIYPFFVNLVLYILMSLTRNYRLDIKVVLIDFAVIKVKNTFHLR